MTDSLDLLLADGIIDGVIGQLKTGKEAEVWLVQHAGQVVAAKLYKERHERNFRNNAGYREGREVRNSRTRRAMEKGSRFGQAAAEDAWKSAEADSLYTLHAQGVRVPTPVMFYEGVLLMELVLDAEGQPAPRLVEAPPATAEDARAMYLDLRSQVVRMLCADLIHGDLSPYNVLMGATGPTLIDFPQTVAAARNNRAEFYFRRDLDNVRNFLAGFDPSLRGTAGDTGEIWSAYVRRDLTPDFSPSGTSREPPRRHGPPGRDGAHGPRDGRPRFNREHPNQNHRPDARPAPAQQPVPPPAPAMSAAEAEEAELRALEALVLRQGGGERGRPPAAPAPRDGRKRPFPPHKSAPGGGSPGRPAQGQRPPGKNPHRGNAPPAGGGQHGKPAGSPPPARAQHGGKPPSSRPMNGGPQGAARHQRAPGHEAGAPHGTSHGAGSGGGHPRQQRGHSNQDSRGRPPHGKSRMPRNQGSAPQVSYVSRAAPPKTHS